MMFRALSASFAVACCLAAACTPVPVDALHARSAFDLSCPSDQLNFTPIGGNCKDMDKGAPCVMGVSGCGKNATYTYVIRDQAWVR
jgi:hypothetical protein